MRNDNGKNDKTQPAERERQSAQFECDDGEGNSMGRGRNSNNF